MRTLCALPVFSALACTGFAHGRFWLAAPLMMLLAMVLLSRRHFEHSQNMVLAAAIVSALVGFFVPVPPGGAVPPALLAPMTAVLMALSTYCAITDRRHFAWIYAWLLVILSCNVAMTPAFVICLELGAITSALAFLVNGRAHQLPGAGVLAFFSYVAITCVFAWRVSLFVFASEERAQEWLMRFITPRQNASVELKAQVDQPLSDEPVLDLLGPAPAYLRSGVFDRFDGWSFWVNAQTSARRLTLPGGEGTPLSITMLGGDDESLPAPAGVHDVQTGKFEVHGGSIITAEDVAGTTVTFVLGPERLPEEPPSQLTLPPKLEAELKPIADELLKHERDPISQATQLARFFSNNFEYSLQMDLRGEGHPLAVLVKERRPAFCTYFASAMVALLAARGVPSRLVTGFVPSETDGDRTIVRARDAHAWVEVYADGHFIPFDPTPFASRNAALGIARTPFTLVDAITAAVRRAFAGIRHAPGRTLLALMRSPVTLILAAVSGLIVLRRRFKAVSPSPAKTKESAPDDVELDAIYARYQRALRTIAIERGPSETDAELLQRIRQTHPELAHMAHDFIAAFARARFG